MGWVTCVKQGCAVMPWCLTRVWNRHSTPFSCKSHGIRWVFNPHWSRNIMQSLLRSPHVPLPKTILAQHPSLVAQSPCWKICIKPLSIINLNNMLRKFHDYSSQWKSHSDIYFRGLVFGTDDSTRCEPTRVHQPSTAAPSGSTTNSQRPPSPRGKRAAQDKALAPWHRTRRTRRTHGGLN